MSDIMLLGVLRMPYELAMSDDLSSMQFHQRAQQAADRIAELERLAVTNILLDVVPGEDGMGTEIYAKSIDDVTGLLTALGEKIESLEAALAKAQEDTQRLDWLSWGRNIKLEKVTTWRTGTVKSGDMERHTWIVTMNRGGTYLDSSIRGALDTARHTVAFLEASPAMHAPAAPTPDSEQP